MALSAGPCSVCASGGDAFFVRAVGSDQLFFACPACGLAWTGAPRVALETAEVDEPHTFAPDGFALATRVEITAAGLGDLIAEEIANENAARMFDGLVGFVPPVE
jgi:hypothetical protein